MKTTKSCALWMLCRMAKQRSLRLVCCSQTIYLLSNAVCSHRWLQVRMDIQLANNLLQSLQETTVISGKLIVSVYDAGVHDIERHTQVWSVQHIINVVITRHGMYRVCWCGVVVMCRSFAQSSASEAWRARHVPSVCQLWWRDPAQRDTDVSSRRCRSGARWSDILLQCWSV